MTINAAYMQCNFSPIDFNTIEISATWYTFFDLQALQQLHEHLQVQFWASRKQLL